MRDPKSIVYVEWYDSVSRDGWCEEGAPVSRIFTIGWLVEETSDSLQVSAHHDRNPHTRSHCDIMTIPKICILKWYTVMCLPSLPEATA